MTYLFDSFFTLEPIPVSDYCHLLAKFEQEFDRIKYNVLKTSILDVGQGIKHTSIILFSASTHHS